MTTAALATLEPPMRGSPALGPAAVLAQLRGENRKRPRVDPGLGGGLREWLEDGIAEAVASLPPATPTLLVHKRALARAHCGVEPSEDPTTQEVSIPLARGALVDALFRQLVTTGSIEDPMDDALAALEVDERQRAVADFVKNLAAAECSELCDQVTAHAVSLQANWPTLDARWLPRTQDRIAIALGGGRVVLSGVLDLIVGAPSTGRASVCIVELKTGVPRPEHREDLHFYGLLETIRSGAPPFRVATYYSGTGELDAEDVTEDLLGCAVRRTIDGVSELCRRTVMGVPGL